jgi:hypothetical protein
VTSLSKDDALAEALVERGVLPLLMASLAEPLLWACRALLNMVETPLLRTKAHEAGALPPVPSAMAFWGAAAAVCRVICTPVGRHGSVDAALGLPCAAQRG